MPCMEACNGEKTIRIQFGTEVNRKWSSFLWRIPAAVAVFVDPHHMGLSSSPVCVSVCMCVCESVAVMNVQPE